MIEKTYGEIKYGTTVKPKGRIIFALARILRIIADIIMGLRSGFPLCCIWAYITYDHIFFVEGVQRVLCQKCYKKYKKVINNGRIKMSCL